LILRCIS
ncbi:EPSP synthase family protein, partial [Vibrio parahaemolyticus V-223/04]